MSTASGVGAAAGDCNDAVSTEAALSAAITCFNGQTVAGSHTITLSDDILYTTTGTAITNSTAGAALTINGAGFTVDADGNGSVFLVNSGNITFDHITITGGSSFIGGGINSDNGTITVANSTITGNAATSSGGGFYSAKTATITNSTISNNTSAVNGGGLNSSGTTMNVYFSTITNNTAPVGAGLWSWNSAGNSTNVGASIVADNNGAGGDVDYTVATGPNTFNSLGYNVIGDGNATGNFNATQDTIIGVAGAGLGLLADNGGPTETHLPATTSPAIDRFNITTGLPTWDQATDQRGVTRTSGAKDSGAVETLCNNSPTWTVASQPDLSAAIGCFNAETVPGPYTITLTDNIDYTTTGTSINNSTSAVTLLIDGAGFTVDGNALGSVFVVNNGDVTFDAITLTGGSAPDGGGIYNPAGNVTVTNSTITNNTAGTVGGGVYFGGTGTVTNSTITANTAFVGGGIYNNLLAVSVDSSTVSNNNATLDGGGIYDQGTMTVTNSTVTGNTATNNGGGIYNASNTVNVYFSTITNNTAIEGAGIWSHDFTLPSTRVGASIVTDNNGAGGDVDGAAGGGGVVAGVEAIPGPSISDGFNVIGDGNATAIFNHPQDITGVSANLGPLADNSGPTFTHLPADSSLAVDRFNATTGLPTWDQATDQRGITRPVGVKDAGAVEIPPCVQSPDWTVSSEPGLSQAIGCFNAETTAGPYTITVSSSIVYATAGTPIDNSSADITLLIDGAGFKVGSDTNGSVFRVDNGDVTFDAININGGSASFGGGIYNAGTVTVIDSAIYNNTATADGGGIYNADGGILTVSDSTISGNTATSKGGAIYNAHATVSVVYSTVTANNSPEGAGLWSFDQGDTTTQVAASIVAGNAGGDDVVLGALGDATNSFTSGGFNIIGTGNTGGLANFTQPGDMTGEPAGVNVLADNGGPTVTHLPLAGATAIDHVTGPPNLFGSTAPTTDQRGIGRPQGLANDAGAVEVEPELTVLPVSCPVLDTTGAFGGGSLTPGTVRTVQVTGGLPFGQGVPTGTCIPPAEGASAVVFTVSALNPTGVGNLRLAAESVAAQGGVVNFVGNGLNNANTVTVPVSADGKVDISTNGAATNARLVVVGYYSQTGTLKYNTLNPCAMADSRTTGTNPASGLFAGPFASGGAAYPDINVVGKVPPGQGGNADHTPCGVPATADAVVVNLVAIRPQGVVGFGGPGYLSAATQGIDPFEPVTPFADLTLNNATSIIIPLNASGKIAIDIDQLSATPVSAHIRVVILGYLDDTTGDNYTPVNPCAAFDTRPNGTNPSGGFLGKRLHNTPTTFNITDSIPPAQGGETDCAVPTGATSVLINLVAIQSDFVGNLKAYATGTTPTGGVVNFANLTPAMNNSNTISVPLDANGNLDIDVNSPLAGTNPTTHVRGVILGYYS